MAEDPGTATEARQIKVDIAGMTCAACERRVAKALTELPEVATARASARDGTATVTATSVPSRADLAAALAAAGYRLGSTPWLSRSRRTWVVALVAGAIVAGALILADALGLTDLAGTLGAPGSGGLLMVALIGLAAGASTCMALVGGVVLAISATYPAPVGAGPVRRLRPQLAFHFGRIAGFGLLGAALGALGAELVMPALLQGLLMVAVSVVMAILGVRLTGVSPRLAGWSPTLPRSWSKLFGATDRPGHGYSDLRAAGAGAATFFLPCGFTQAVQLYALSTGSPLQAGLVMAVFALGTAPGLLALAGVPALVGTRVGSRLSALVGVLLLGFAAFNLLGAGRVLGLQPTAPVADSAHPLSANVRLVGGVQIVSMEQQDTAYSPATTYVKAGVPISWQITSTSPFSCAAFLRVPDVGVEAHLKAGLNSVAVPALRAGAVPFTCAMGMYSGELIAIDNPGAG
jgi:sulfite exporter TauE/SafE/copper chaperone CopZ